jgi:hypothetical protein
MKVLVSKESKDGTFEWRRTGTNISYYQNNIKRDSTGNSHYYYTLTFTTEMDPGASYYFAYCYPYTYTRLKQDLKKLMETKG